MSPADLEIIPVKSKKDFKDFVKFPYDFYKNDPHWIPPLYMERMEALHPKKNPYYQHAQVQLFLAKKNGKVVGRISAQIDFEYEKLYKKRLGQFGFFECENNPETSHALFQAAEQFLKQNGVQEIQGPFNFSINEETGLLIHGFDQPLVLMMPYNPPYYSSLIEQEGYKKIKDLYAWKYDIGEISPDAQHIADEMKKHPGLIVRPINMKDLNNELRKIIDILNSAWSENWGFVPFTESEINKMAKDMKMFADPNGILIAELEGKPIAMVVMLPNIYDMISDLNGKLFPFGLFKLLWRIKKKKYKSGRMLLLGVKKEYRNTALGGMSILLYAESHRYGKEGNIQWGELSWTLEDNKAVNMGIEFMGGKRYKTFRIYQKEISS